METKISFKRIGLLLQRFFIENGKSQLMFWGVMVVLYSFVVRYDLFWIFTIISGVVFTGIQFNMFKSTPRASQYLTLPATALEKLTTQILLQTIYFLVMSVLVYTLGNAIGWTINETVPGKIVHEFFGGNHWELFRSNNRLLKWILVFILSQAVYMVGALYFNRNSILKTILFTNLLGLITALYSGLLINFVLKPYKNFSGSIMVNDDSFDFQYSSYILIFFILYLWVVSYVRLTEKEV